MANIKIEDITTKTASLSNTDKLVGTDSDDSDASKNFLIEDIRNLSKSQEIIIAKDGTGDYNCTGTDHDGDDQTVINTAINAANAGDTIIFKPATYYLKGKGGNNEDQGYWGSIHITKKLHIIAYGAIFNAKQGVELNEYSIPEKDEYIACFQNFSTDGISGSSWKGGEIIFTDRDASPTSGGGGIWVEAYDNTRTQYFEFKNVIIEDVVIMNNETTSFGTYGIYNNRGFDVKINNCSFYYTNSSALVWDGNSTDDGEIHNMIVSNCYFNNCARAIKNNNTNYYFRGLNISDCLLEECEFGINIASTYNININNVTINNNQESAIQLNSNSTNNEIQLNCNNIVINNITTSGKDAINIGGVNNVTLSNIDIINTQTYSIEFFEGKCKNIILDNIRMNNENSLGDGRGINFFWDSGDKFENITLSNIVYYGDHFGLLLRGIQNINMSNITIIDTTTSSLQNGITLYNTSVDAKLSNVYIDGYSGGNKISLSNTGIQEVINVTDYEKITTGTTAPSSTPTKVGDQFIDTTNGNIYIAKGTTSSADWVQVNN